MLYGCLQDRRSVILDRFIADMFPRRWYGVEASATLREVTVVVGLGCYGERDATAQTREPHDALVAPGYGLRGGGGIAEAVDEAGAEEDMYAAEEAGDQSAEGDDPDGSVEEREGGGDGHAQVDEDKSLRDERDAPGDGVIAT